MLERVHDFRGMVIPVKLLFALVSSLDEFFANAVLVLQNRPNRLVDGIRMIRREQQRRILAYFAKL